MNHSAVPTAGRTVMKNQAVLDSPPRTAERSAIAQSTIAYSHAARMAITGRRRAMSLF
jgi:hypothetical protein